MPTKAQVNEGVERLRVLYSIMPGLPPETVDLSTWRSASAEDNWDRLTDKKLIKRAKKPWKHCDTQACAMGWAAAHPYFRELGLSFTQEHGLHLTQDPDAGDEWVGIETLFSISHKVALYLFAGGDQVYPDHHKYSAARRIALSDVLGFDSWFWGSTSDETDQRKKVMIRILTHLALTQRWPITRVLDASLRMHEECKMGVRVRKNAT